MKYVTSDIHGEYDLFLKLLEKIGFCDDDELFVCGDLVDKGKRPIALMRYLMSKPNVKCVLGNHDYMQLKFYDALMAEDGFSPEVVLKRLQEHFPCDGYLLDWEVVDWLESLPFYIETEDFICTHAGLPVTDEGKAVEPCDSVIEKMIYERKFCDVNLLPITDKCIFFGHTPSTNFLHEPIISAYLHPHKTKDNLVLLKDDGVSSASVSDCCKIHLDTGAFLNGVMGCYCVDTGRAIYVRK